MKAKRALLICPDYMGLYKDIVKGLESLKFQVIFIPEVTFPGNPFNVVNKNIFKSKEKYLNKLYAFWKERLGNYSQEELFFDYVLVIDGLSIHPYLFDKLKDANTNIKIICYMFDRIKGVYQVDHNFPLYDKIYSFDKSDCEEYQLEHLPIYWVPSEEDKVVLDVFAFGGYDKNRLSIYKRLEQICVNYDFSNIIKIYVGPINNKYWYEIKRIILNTFFDRDILSFKELKFPIFTYNFMSTDEFRKTIIKSNVVVDTNHSYQDGLTARFMWALGAGRKIITNNNYARNYDFYNEKQILILDNKVSDSEIADFIKSDYEMNENTRTIINQFRIDNWLLRLLIN